MSQQSVPWRVSLHGGHSGAYCDHAVGALRDVLESAATQGFAVYGVSEHAPRLRQDLVYPEEQEQGWTVQTLEDNFAAYTAELEALQQEFDGRLTVLRGFELEVVPDDRWLEIMQGYRQGPFDFVVGSIHYVREQLIDGPVEGFEKIMHECGGLDVLGVEYYRALGNMVRAFRPEVVGHFDLIRKNGRHFGVCDTPVIREAALQALDVVAQVGGILDLNTAALRKGMETPYPAPWLVEEALKRGVPFCFGDDSHGPDDVGLGIDESRAYLIDCGVRSITTLDRQDGKIVRREIPLD